MSIHSSERVQAKPEEAQRKRKRSTTSSTASTSTTTNPVHLVQDFMSETTATASFTLPTESMIAAYTMEVMSAARSGDLHQLRALSNQNLDCCNRFGESLLHFCCRRGYTDMVKYLIQEKASTVSIVDDSNRNILHFACWTAEPNVELVRFLLQTLPWSFLFAKDIRGHTPFHYVRQEHWGVWCDVIRSHIRSIEEHNKRPRRSKSE